MKVIQAIAYKMVKEAIKMKLSVVLFFILFAILPTLPLILKSDGMLKSHVQVVLTYSLSLTSLILYLLSLFLTTLSFTNEIKYKQFYLIDTKPVNRYFFFLGKFFGIAIINFVFLFAMSFIILIGIIFLVNYSGNKDERIQVKEQIFTAYLPCKPEIDIALINARVEDRKSVV